MRNFILSIIINWISLLVLDHFLIGWIRVLDWKTALFAGFVLALLNALVRPILMVLSMPFNLITLGLFTFVVNAIILYFAQYLVKGFTLNRSFLVILALAFLMSLLNGFLSSLLKRKN